jgi:Lon protease-like protein
MEQIGLFPLGIVLLPTERIPLHIFEARYRELIGECLEDDSDFGLIYADEDGVREIGTRARVTEVIDRLDDGRLNVLVEGGERFRVERLTRGRSFLTAEIRPVVDEVAGPGEAAQRALESFRALVALAGAEAEELDEDVPELSYALAAHVELGVEAKQRLLELLSEEERLELVAELFDAVRTTLLAAHSLNERAKQNGNRLKP